MVVEAQATPRLAQKVIDCIRGVTDKPISHVVLTHYRAVRVPGASAFGAGQVIMSEAARNMVAGRGPECLTSAPAGLFGPNLDRRVSGASSP